ncbi:unnamed protein product, partial [Staurois parvus]
MIQSPSRHIPCLLLENVPEFPAPLTSPVSSSIIFLVTSRIFCNPPHLSSQQVDDLQGEVLASSQSCDSGPPPSSLMMS